MNKLGRFFSQYRKLWFTLVVVVIPAVIIASALQRVSAEDSIEQIAIDWGESGHADFTSRSFTFWDNNDPPLIPADCASCHSLHGAMDYVGARGTPAGSVAHDMPIGSVVSCAACHTGAAHALQSVSFPSGQAIAALPGEGTCLMCHMGTESGASVDQAIAGRELDTVGEGLAFINVHYHVAAATLMGTTGQGGYEYAHADYAGRYDHAENFQSCTSCHDVHSLEVEPLTCSTCHANVTTVADFRDIRETRIDFDGDGDTRKGIAFEIDSFHGRLYDAIQRYAQEVVGVPIVYSSAQFPYFFVDSTNGGEPDPADFNFGNRYTQWTPRLLQAAYNYHFVKKDSGAYSHNPHYVLQLLYDSLHDINERVAVDVDGLTRPQSD